jgi:hypothetical protein
MHPYRDSRITKAILVIFFIIVILYAYFEARGILFGPSINIWQSIEHVTSPYIEISGTTTHISKLSMNGESVPVTETGAFDVPYVLAPGYNRLVFDASDKYGQSTERVIVVVYSTTTQTTSSFISTSTNTTSPASTHSTSTGQATSSQNRGTIYLITLRN